MNLKKKLIAGYAVMGLAVLLYHWTFVPGAGFAIALGKGLVWPAVLVPGVGAFIGGIILIAFLVAIYVI